MNNRLLRRAIRDASFGALFLWILWSGVRLFSWWNDKGTGDALLSNKFLVSAGEYSIVVWVIVVVSSYIEGRISNRNRKDE